MRVVHLTKYYPPAPGGFETHVRTLALAQARQGAEVRVICVNHRDRNERDVTWSPLAWTPTVEEDDDGVKLTRVGKRGSVVKLDVCPGLLRQLAALSPARVDVLHLHVPNPTMVLALSAIRPKIPLVITHHSDVVKQRVLRYAIAPFERLLYGRAVKVLATSPAYAPGSPMLQRWSDKVEVLPLGIDLRPYLNPSAAALEHARRFRERLGEPLWLSVGRLVYYKGLHVAISALKDVPGTLLVVGRGPLRSELERQARSSGVADRAVFQDYAAGDELVGAYHAATALWFPSVARSEGFGLVQVEAMASGCPPLNAAVPDSGVAWVSPHESTGLTVPIENAVALSAASRRLLEEPQLRSRLVDAGRERVIREFDHELMARRSLEIYRRVVGAVEPRPSVQGAVT